MSGKDVLDRWFAAFNAHDLDALCRLADPDIEIIPMPGSATVPAGAAFHGHDGLRSAIEPSFQRWPHMRLEHAPARDVGGRLVADVLFVLDDGSPDPDEVRTACIYSIHGQRLRRLEAFDKPSGLVGVEDFTAESTRVGELSPREREVLLLLAHGQTIENVGESLFISTHTVRTHVRNAKEKLSARTMAHAVAMAARTEALNA